MDTAGFESTDPGRRGWGATLEKRLAVRIAHDLASVPAALAEAETAAGDTYQVNLTFPLTALAPPDPAALFDRLRDATRVMRAAAGGSSSRTPGAWRDRGAGRDTPRSRVRPVSG